MGSARSNERGRMAVVPASCACRSAHRVGGLCELCDAMVQLGPASAASVGLPRALRTLHAHNEAASTAVAPLGDGAGAADILHRLSTLENETDG